MSLTSVALFTRDLRVHDNPVLSAAAANGPVVPLFVVDQGCRQVMRPNRAAFLVQSLDDLSAALRTRGAGLVVRSGDVVEQVCDVAARVGAQQVHMAADVSRYAQRREQRLVEALTDAGRELVVHDGCVTVVPPGRVAPQVRDHFAVFTPYYRRWREQPLRALECPPGRLTMPRIPRGQVPRPRTLCAGETSPHLPAGGETAARRRLSAWLADLERYASDSDQLALDATSRLSPYLHFGCLSPTELLHRAGERGSGAGPEAFIRQLAWRDFHHQVLAARPTSSTTDYRTQGDQWRDDTAAFDAWREGRTGYPIVDAGMRQLLAEGWMHNRARLIVASFLVKTLYVDWRLGARHFMDWLVDGDIANNQMNWQWIAGTGTDSRPNRVLNPITQARRLDPTGAYVRRYVHELATVDDANVHEPWRQDRTDRRALDYPEPIVDLGDALRRFRVARGKE